MYPSVSEEVYLRRYSSCTFLCKVGIIKQVHSPLPAFPKSKDLRTKCFFFPSEFYMKLIWWQNLTCHGIYKNLYFFSFFFRFLGATHAAYGDSQARGRIRAGATATATAIQDSSSVSDLHHSSWQHRILNPLSEARDWTLNLTVPSQIHFHCAMTATPEFIFLIIHTFCSRSSNIFSFLKITFYIFRTV